MSMPNVPPPDQRAPQDADDNSISRAGGPSRQYSDLKSSIETALQDAINGVHLTNVQRFWASKSFVKLGIRKLFRAFPDDKELQSDLREMKDEDAAIQPPHPTFVASVSQGMRVLEVKAPRSDSSVDVPQTDLAPGLMDRMMQRDYAEVLDKMLDLVSDVAFLLEERGLLNYKMEELAVEEEYEGEDTEEDDGEPY
jgi:hypothetical protein